MKLLFDYTLDYIKRNKRSSFAIMVALLMTATMLSALCGFLYNTYADNLSLIVGQTGDWHGELFGDTPGSALPVIEQFDSVQSIMIKGEWNAAQIDDPRREYLSWRDANAAYWQSMPEGNSLILEGRLPAKPGEIALSKQYFENHPELTLGDSITLPTGDRIAGDTVVPPQSVSKTGERFVQTGEVTLTVVAKMDVTTSSTVPAYTALGYLDRQDILPDDGLTVYFRFNNIRDTYKELPKIAEAVGYEKDEYGNYLLRYNSRYLLRMAVFSPEQMTQLASVVVTSQMPLMFGIIGLLVAGVFVLIIHNAFALSFSARLSQLGIFSSVGATPKQIKRSVVIEALLLTAIPLPLGLIIGQGVVYLFINYANGAGATVDPMTFVLSWQSVVPAILLTLLTVWWSALIPARKIARMSPIDAIRQGGTQKLKKPRRFSIYRLGSLFGLPGELAANALQARKSSYRTATISLTLSFLTLACFLCINSASTASMAVYKTNETLWAQKDIELTLYNVATTEDLDMINERVGGMDAVSCAVWYSEMRTVAWIPEHGFSADFEQRGGFAEVEKSLSSAQVPLLREEKRRVGVTILGVDDNTFAAYCSELGIDPAPFYDQTHWSGILYHTVNDVTTSTRLNPAPIPFLDIAAGDVLTLSEKTVDDREGDFSFDMQVSAIANILPPVAKTVFGVRYSAVQVMPMSRARELGANFERSSIMRVEGVIQVTDPAQITPTRARIEQICESYFGSGDYFLYDENEYYANEALARTTMSMMFGFIVALLAVIGLSNAWSTVRGTLNARRREFAMLRSVGLPPKGLKRMLTLEALMLGLTPILASLPLVIILQGVFLGINEVSLVQWLPFAPWLPLLVYIAAVLAVTVIAYAIGGRKLLGENIIDAIKMGSI